MYFKEKVIESSFNFDNFCIKIIYNQNKRKLLIELSKILSYNKLKIFLNLRMAINMSWWNNADETDSEESEEVLFKDKDELAKVGHDLYVEVMNKTSNKDQKDQIRKTHETSGSKFTDPQFPPNSSCLAKD